MKLPPSSRMGPYEILEPLGAGGMGEVYRARDTRLGRDVALKVVKGAPGEDARRRFEREARLASSLSHPNVCAVFDVGRAGDADYVVFELVRGETLHARLARGPLPPDELVSTAEGIAAGLAAAHEAGIVHRDLKPSNVMLTPHGPKILDFGLARVQSAATESGVATATGPLTARDEILGTAPYMSPEQAAGRPLDARSDVFSFGAMLYEMASGRRAFAADSTAETLAAILREDPPPLAHAAHGVSPVIASLVDACLCKDPALRPAKGSSLVAALRSAGTAPAPRAAARRRRPAPALAAGAVLLVVAAGVWVARSRTAPATAHALAVLPLKPLADGTDDEALGIGIADAVIGRLARTGAVIVRPTSAVRRYAAADAAVGAAAARELAVDAVLEGTLQRAGGRLRASVSLVSADGRVLDGQSFDVAPGDVFAVQDAIASRVADRLALRLDPSQRARLGKRYTSSPEAFEAFSRGMEAVARGENLKAVELFQKAVDLDPSYALARARLGGACVWRNLFVDHDDAWLARGQRELAEAERLDPQLAYVHVVRHGIFWSRHHDFDIGGAVAELRTAQRLDPSEGHGDLGILYAHMGLDIAARRELEKAIEIDPNDLNVRDLRAESYIHLFRPADAIEELRTIARLNPGSAEVDGLSDNMLKPLALLWTGRFADARTVLDRRLAKDPGPGNIEVSLRELAAAIDRDRPVSFAALDRATEALRRDRRFHHHAYNVAAIHALRGDAAKAVEWLEATVRTGMPNLPLFRKDPHFDRIRNDPRFTAFLETLRPVWERYARDAGETLSPGS